MTASVGWAGGSGVVSSGGSGAGAGKLLPRCSRAREPDSAKALYVLKYGKIKQIANKQQNKYIFLVFMV